MPYLAFKIKCSMPYLAFKVCQSVTVSLEKIGTCLQSPHYMLYESLSEINILFLFQLWSCVCTRNLWCRSRRPSWLRSLGSTSSPWDTRPGTPRHSLPQLNLLTTVQQCTQCTYYSLPTSQEYFKHLFGL